MVDILCQLYHESKNNLNNILNTGQYRIDIDHHLN